MGRRLFNKVASLPLANLEANSSSYWQALFRDVDLVRNTLSGAPALLFVDLPFTILFFTIIWIIAQPLVPVLAIIWALYIFIAWRSSAIMRQANNDERETTQNRDSLISEILNARTTVKALGLDRAIRPIWEEAHANNIEKSADRGSKVDSYSNLGGSLSMATTIGLTTAGALAIINQEMTMGALVATNMLSGRLLGPLNQLVGTWRVYSSFLQAVDRLGTVFATESDRMEKQIDMERPNGDIAIEDITFSYEEGGPKIIDGIKIGIRPGGLHAIVGRNGSGKTTLVKILQGLYHPTSGRVMLDGADINQFSREELTSWIGYVPQETILFAGTVRDNIVYGWPTADDEQIIDAATKAGVHRFIIDLPDGYGSEIGEAGQKLSGGQRQRISIARALVGNPAVLILDEPSANLDRQAEEELRETLKELAKTHTVLVVTHSPVMLQGCDNLIAIDRGKIAVAGPAKDILPRLFGTQAGGRMAAADGADAAAAAAPAEASQTAPTTPAPAAPAAPAAERPARPARQRPPGRNPNAPPRPDTATVAPTPATAPPITPEGQRPPPANRAAAARPRPANQAATRPARNGANGGRTATNRPAAAKPAAPRTATSRPAATRPAAAAVKQPARAAAPAVEHDDGIELVRPTRPPRPAAPAAHEDDGIELVIPTAPQSDNAPMAVEEPSIDADDNIELVRPSIQAAPVEE